MQTVELPEGDTATPRVPARQWPGWGVIASVGAHVLIALVLVFGLPMPQTEKPEEQAVNVEIVPPPEEKKPEAAKPEQKPEEKPEQPQEQQDKQAAEAKPAPIQALRPVVEFGEKDAGPRQSPDGGAASEPQPADAKPEEPKPVAPDGAVVVVVPQEKPPLELKEARKLFSPGATGDLLATTAMAGMPRGQRAGELCATELREQLRHAATPFSPDLIPSYRLDEGTLMEVRTAAFRAAGQWHDLAFRCEIDDAATKVTSFAFQVGAPIPRSEWKRRGFPDG